MTTDAEVTAAHEALGGLAISETDVRAALDAAEEARLGKIRQQNVKAFEEFARPEPKPYVAANGNRFTADQARLITEPLRYDPEETPTDEEVKAAEKARLRAGKEV